MVIYRTHHIHFHGALMILIVEMTMDTERLEDMADLVQHLPVRSITRRVNIM